MLEANKNPAAQSVMVAQNKKSLSYKHEGASHGPECGGCLPQFCTMVGIHRLKIIIFMHLNIWYF